jgi:hypothetical protein
VWAIDGDAAGLLKILRSRSSYSHDFCEPSTGLIAPSQTGENVSISSKTKGPPHAFRNASVLIGILVILANFSQCTYAECGDYLHMPHRNLYSQPLYENYSEHGQSSDPFAPQKRCVSCGSNAIPASTTSVPVETNFDLHGVLSDAGEANPLTTLALNQENLSNHTVGQYPSILRPPISR